MARPKVNMSYLIGQQFGEWIVLEDLGLKKHSRVFLCLCTCGTQKKLYKQSFIGGSSTNCGCKKPKFHELGAKFATYKYNAKARGYEFAISIKEFEILVCNSCFYCGDVAPNGVDRIDNSKGYTINNVVTCCKICNWMKLNQTQEDFITHVKKIANFSCL